MSRRKRATQNQVNYRESSLDFDQSDVDYSEEPQAKRLQLTQLPTRQSTRTRSANYAEPPTEDEQSDEDRLEELPPKTRPTARPFRQSSRAKPTLARTRSLRSRKVPSYRESSAGHEGGDEDDFQGISAKQRRITALPKRKPRPRPKQSQPLFGGFKRTKSTKFAATKNPPVKDEEVAVVDQSTVPPWQTLPYGVLLSIFQYASRPLYDSRYDPTPAVDWLLKMALLCRSFAEPALSALYYSPPLSPPHAQGLLAHLMSQNGSPTFNYRAKIKYLDIEAMSTLVRKYKGQPSLDIPKLIRLTPMLRGIETHLITDQPQHHKIRFGSSSRSANVYNLELFEAIVEAQIRLRSWKWNFGLSGDLHTTSELLTQMPTIHAMALKNLESVTFVGYMAVDLFDRKSLAEALANLPNLKKLSFELCDVSEHLLPMLPYGLESLKLIDCPDVTADDLHLFLITHGRCLHELILNHNQSLNMAFIVDLADACPNLEVFHMDMTYFSTNLNTKDTEPLYDTLLVCDETPTWPSTLRSLELVNLRRWNGEAAEMFFRSLVDSAASLPQLRRLVLKAIIDITWRDRANFRNKWIGKLREVFLDDSLPNPKFKSIRAFYAAKGSVVKSRSVEVQIEKPLIDNKGRKSARLTLNPPKRLLVDGDSDSDVPLSIRRGKRRRKDGAEGGYSSSQLIEVGSDNDVSVRPKKRNKSSTSHDSSDYNSSSDSDNPIMSNKRKTSSIAANNRSTLGNASGSRNDSNRVKTENTIKTLASNSIHTTRLKSPKRRQKLTRKCKQSDSSQPQTDVEMTDASARTRASYQEEYDKEDQFIQGRCAIVDIRIDNTRPSEEQYKESDFLDVEKSGDEDWNGEDPDGDGRYAW